MSVLKSGRPTNKQKTLEGVRDNQETFIRMNVNIAKDFHKKIKQRALDEDITVTELIHKAVKEYLSK
jgi:predicted HicB family RNase H-like nuclease